MMIDLLFIFNSILLGVGLAMDAFSVSIGNGLAEPDMKHGRMSLMAGCYAFFQFAMPMIGWALVHTLISVFNGLTVAIPWIALILLLFIGGKMIFESIKEIRESKKKDPEKESEEKSTAKRLTFAMLIIQGIATAIDALSVGLTISEYSVIAALVASFIIAAVTFVICMVGLKIGKMVGKRLGVYAGILGGAILIGIGIEIFVKGMFF